MNYEEFLEKLPDMAVSRPVEAAIFSAMFVALDIRGLETGARLPKNVKTSRAIVLYGNRLAVDMDRLRECLGSDDAATALDLANPYPVKNWSPHGEQFLGGDLVYRRRLAARD
ncbi:MAG: hypothetical protein IID44_10820 [Planctomycetes bacterium]|nr:hypothetical protein [Planctomycetota bacterium]